VSLRITSLQSAASPRMSPKLCQEAVNGSPFIPQTRTNISLGLLYYFSCAPKRGHLSCAKIHSDCNIVSLQILYWFRLLTGVRLNKLQINTPPLAHTISASLTISADCLFSEHLPLLRHSFLSSALIRLRIAKKAADRLYILIPSVSSLSNDWDSRALHTVL